MTSKNTEEWIIIPCPCSITLTSVNKERGTHGSVYILWECDRNLPVWVGQSIPALVNGINEKAIFCASKRLHASSLYRCLRKEARKENHKSWCVSKFSRQEIDEINAFIKKFPSVIFISKSPELWRCSLPTASPETSAEIIKKNDDENEMSRNVSISSDMFQNVKS